MSERRTIEVGVLIGRILIGVMFLAFAYERFNEMEKVIAFFGDRLGYPAPAAIAWVSAIVEAVGGLCLILGVRPRVVALILAIYLLLPTLTVHLDFANQFERAHFYKNLAVIGGLVGIWSTGGGTRFRLLG